LNQTREFKVRSDHPLGYLVLAQQREKKAQGIRVPVQSDPQLWWMKDVLISRGSEIVTFFLYFRVSSYYSYLAGKRNSPFFHFHQTGDSFLDLLQVVSTHSLAPGGALS
jgi:hypothetical protein